MTRMSGLYVVRKPDGSHVVVSAFGRPTHCVRGPFATVEDAHLVREALDMHRGTGPFDVDAAELRRKDGDPR